MSEWPVCHCGSTSAMRSAVLCSSAAASSGEIPGRRRATASSQCHERASRRRSPTWSGSQISADPRSANWKWLGRIPMTVNGRSLSERVRPITSGSPPKRDCQQPHVSTARGAASTPLSPGSNSRPAAASTPSMRKKLSVTLRARTRSGVLPAVSVTLPPLYPATSSNRSSREDQSTKSGYDASRRSKRAGRATRSPPPAVSHRRPALPGSVARDPGPARRRSPRRATVRGRARRASPAPCVSSACVPRQPAQAVRGPTSRLTARANCSQESRWASSARRPAGVSR